MGKKGGGLPSSTSAYLEEEQNFTPKALRGVLGRGRSAGKPIQEKYILKRNERQCLRKEQGKGERDPDYQST